MGEVFQELRRRNIFRVAVAYAALSWVILQVAGLIAPALGLPDWSFSLVLFILVIGFPLALIFSWAFELTPEGLKRTADIHPEHSVTPHTGRKLDFVIIGVLSAALLLLVIDRLFMPRPDEQGALPNGPGVITAGSWSSIAVMPFVNMSSDPDQEYFSDGISEELLNVLSKAEGLRVAARTSSFSFKGTNTAITEIGNLLNVETVLEGSVRKSGTKLRITAQLIDVATGYHIWSETYDREIRDIFAIQDEIARSIASAMSTHLTGLDETAEPKHQPDLEAYNYYLAGRRLIDQRTPESIGKAVGLLDQATTADPLFAAAYSSKAEALWFSNRYRGLPVAEAKSQVLELIDKALELDPDMAEAYAVRGLLYGSITLYLDTKEVEPRQDIIELERAISLNPNLAKAHHWLAVLYARSGRIGDTLREMELAYELDPLHPILMLDYAWNLMEAGRYQEARVILGKKDLIDTSRHQKSLTVLFQLELYFLQGNITEAYRLAAKLRELAPERHRLTNTRFIYLSLKEPGEPLYATSRYAKVWLYLIQGRSDEARSMFDVLEQKVSEDSYNLHLGCILALEGDFEAAVAAFEQVFWEREGAYRFTERAIWYALSLIETGRRQDADRVLDDIMKRVDRWKSDGAIWYLTALPESEVWLLHGDEDRALDVLEQTYDQGMRLRAWRNYPIFAPLREHPRFVALFDKIDEDIKAARIEVGLDKPSKLVEPN